MVKNAKIKCQNNSVDLNPKLRAAKIKGSTVYVKLSQNTPCPSHLWMWGG